MAKTLVVYATRTGETQKIGELIAEGIRFSGHEAMVSSINDIKSEKDLQGYDALIFGSATYHGDMMQKNENHVVYGGKSRTGRQNRGRFRCFRLERRSAGPDFRHHEKYFQDGNGVRSPSLEIEFFRRRRDNGTGLWP